MDIKTFIYVNQARVKNYIKDELFKLGKILGKEILKNKKTIINSSLKISAGIISTTIINLKIIDLINNGLIINKCLVKIEDISTALNTYRLELVKVKENFKKVDISMKKLVNSG